VSCPVHGVRQMLGLSQPELGQLLGAHGMTVSRWERGLRAPGPWELAMLRAMRSTAVRFPERARAVRGLLHSCGATTALVVALGGQFDQ
jgi:putative transcriptional regulator